MQTRAVGERTIEDRRVARGESRDGERCTLACAEMTPVVWIVHMCENSMRFLHYNVHRNQQKKNLGPEPDHQSQSARHF